MIKSRCQDFNSVQDMDLYLFSMDYPEAFQDSTQPNEIEESPDDLSCFCITPVEVH